MESPATFKDLQRISAGQRTIAVDVTTTTGGHVVVADGAFSLRQLLPVAANGAVPLIKVEYMAPLFVAIGAVAAAL